MSWARSLAISAAVFGLTTSPLFAQDVTLRFAWWGGSDRHKVTIKAIELFESKNPGVKIRPEYGNFSGYENGLNTQIASGSEPDIMQVNWAWLPKMTRQQDVLLDLYKYRPQLNLDAFPNESYKSGLVYGRLVGLPTSYTAMVLLWNKSAFERAGLPLPKTWEQLMNAGQVFKAKLGNDYYPIANDNYSLILLSHAYIQQKTGKPYIYANQAKVALSQDEIRDWVGFYMDLFHNHVTMPPQEKYNQKLNGKSIDQLNEWSVGKWAGNYTWDSTIKLRQSGWSSGTKGELGDFITMPGARSSGMYGRPSTMLAISKNTKHPDVAAKLVNFLTTDPEAAVILGTSRGVPMAKTQVDVLQKFNLIQGMELKAYQQISANKLEYPSPLFEQNKMLEFVKKTFENVGRGVITEEQAVSALLFEGNQILKSIK